MILIMHIDHMTCRFSKYATRNMYLLLGEGDARDGDAGGLDP